MGGWVCLSVPSFWEKCRRGGGVALWVGGWVGCVWPGVPPPYYRSRAFIVSRCLLSIGTFGGRTGSVTPPTLCIRVGVCVGGSRWSNGWVSGPAKNPGKANVAPPPPPPPKYHSNHSSMGSLRPSFEEV